MVVSLCAVAIGATGLLFLIAVILLRLVSLLDDRQAAMAPWADLAAPRGWQMVSEGSFSRGPDGRYGGIGYLYFLPVDQGLEHSGGASFAKNPIYLDGEKIIKLTIDGGCNAIATTFGVLGTVSWNAFDQVMYGNVSEAWNLGAAAVDATVYFGSDNATRQIQEVAEAFQHAHELGMATILWCYLRNSAFKKDGTD